MAIDQSAETIHPPATDAAEQRPGRNRLTSLFSNFELVIVVLLGLVSVATAYASFQAALYDSQMAGSYTKGQNASTAAESLYLEANQQYIQDLQIWTRLTELSIEMENSNPEVAAVASSKFDTLYFQSVGDDLAAAITWSSEQNDATPEKYTSPLESEDYQSALYSPYVDTKTQADALIAEGDSHNTMSDRLTLNTVLMALSLFLLGIAAVVRGNRSQLALTIVATGIFIFAMAMTVAIPFVSI